MKNIVKKLNSSLKNLFIPNEENDYSPKIFKSRILFYVIVFVLFLKIVSVISLFPFSSNIFFADITKTDLLGFINKDRSERGLGTLKENEKLNYAAYLKAQDMVQKNYFSHQSPEGITPWYWFSAADYNYRYAGENLAIGFVESSNVYRAWFNSPSHRANILSGNYNEIGTAVLSGFGESNSTVVVQVFGSESIPSTLAVAQEPEIELPNQPVENNNGSEESFVAPEEVLNNNPVEEIEITEESNLENQLANNQTENVLAEESVRNSSIFENIDQNSVLLTKSSNNVKNNTYLRFLNFIVYERGRILQYVSYSLLLFVIAIFSVNILVNYNIQRDKIIFRGLILIGVLYLSSISNETIAQIIPHYVAIS